MTINREHLAPNRVWAIPVRDNGKRTTFYTEQIPFVPGAGVEQLGEPVEYAPIAKAAPEAEPVAWVPSAALAKLRNGSNNAPCVLTDGPAEFNETAVYLAPQHDAELVELLRELAGAAGSVNSTRQHQIEIKGDDEPCYWQRKEWVDYIIELCAKADAKLAALRHV